MLAELIVFIDSMPSQYKHAARASESTAQPNDLADELDGCSAI